jgi:2-polyprenyl-3-methyl-5-hydroxy-6-metoxy-1,4-benzoquinol methylase
VISEVLASTAPDIPHIHHTVTGLAMNDLVREACPVCASPRLRPLRRYAKAHLIRCAECGLTFSGRYPSDAELAGHYEHYGHAWVDSPITRRRYAELLDTFEPYRQTNRLLDVGCGAGFFLEEAHKRGWETHGNEFSRHALKLANSRGLSVVFGPIARETYPGASFDVVTSFEVFEHVRDPREQSSLIARLLRPGGLLYCTTPNFNSLSRRILRDRWSVIEYPEHLIYYTPKTIRSWLEREGFSTLSLTSSGISVGRLRDAVRGRRTEAAPHASGDEALRETLERSPVLGRVKDAVNRTLAASGAGDTLKARFTLGPDRPASGDL